MITGEQVYLPAFQPDQERLRIASQESHHLIRVRHYQEGAEIWAVNGLGTAFRAKIISIQGDHLDLVVEKATELGVSTIVPLLTDHTIKKGLNNQRLERIAVAAMKQGRRSRLPAIEDLTPFKTLVHKTNHATNLFCHANEHGADILIQKASIQAAREVVIWVGPEGDWSQDEIDLASISDYTSTGLGPRRLRAETAALHAVGLVSALL